MKLYNFYHLDFSDNCLHLIDIFKTFRSMYPSDPFRCFSSNSRANMEVGTVTFIQSTMVDCSKSINRDQKKLKEDIIKVII